MNDFIGKVTARGQITIPQKLREEEGIGKDDYVVMRKVGKFIVVSKVESRLDEITEAFQKEAKEKNITKRELLAELENVRKSKRN